MAIQFLLISTSVVFAAHPNRAEWLRAFHKRAFWACASSGHVNFSDKKQIFLSSQIAYNIQQSQVKNKTSINQEEK